MFYKMSTGGQIDKFGTAERVFSQYQKLIGQFSCNNNFKRRLAIELMELFWENIWKYFVKTTKLIILKKNVFISKEVSNYLPEFGICNVIYDMLALFSGGVEVQKL